MAIAHCFAAGVDATVGSNARCVRRLDVVPLSVFDGPDYVALGHIHGRQQISERVRYAGAPLHYSFGEQDKPRGSWLVELDAEGLATVEWLELPVPRRLVTLTGSLEEILAADTVAAHADDWVCAVYHGCGAAVRADAASARELSPLRDGSAPARSCRRGGGEVVRAAAALRRHRCRPHRGVPRACAGRSRAHEVEHELIRAVLDERVRAEALV